MDFSERKQLRIDSYDYDQNGAYFVTVCVQDRKKLLSVIVGDDAYIVPKPYGQVAEKYISHVPQIVKYVIMPDHIHMIICLDEENGIMPESERKHPQQAKIAKIVRSFKTLVTKEIGVSIFQRSYYDHVIRNRQDFVEIWNYIDNNPRKWMMGKGIE